MKNYTLFEIKEIKAEPYAGTHIDRVKVEISNYAKIHKCRIYFTFNCDKYICDKEGNIALLN